MGFGWLRFGGGGRRRGTTRRRTIRRRLGGAQQRVRTPGATAQVVVGRAPNVRVEAEEIRRRLEKTAERRMAAQIQDSDAGELEVVRAQRRGISAAPVILEYASGIDADLIVMSTHGRRGLTAALLGSVTEEVVRLSECPVLTIRTDDLDFVHRVEHLDIVVQRIQEAYSFNGLN